ncbi:MAG: sigma-70 family RNA polymerase sigma factor, partial [Christensenellaceae bacterium]|nr:sigma-70 family RNA polymerase sigma factor [Christensenellaceae bacterium]
LLPQEAAAAGIDFEELCQAGAVGLIKAVGSFDPARNISLASYAFRFIEGEMRSFLRESRSIRLNRAARETAVRAMRLAEELAQEKGDECRIEELALKMKMEPAELCAALNASMGCVSLDDEIGGPRSEDMMSDDSASRDVDRVLDNALINSLMERLNKRERSVILLRYRYDLTQTQIAKRLKMSQAQVSRYERSALVKMKEYAGVEPFQ